MALTGGHADVSGGVDAPGAALGAGTGAAEEKTLAAAIAASHVAHAEAGPGMHIALNWFRMDDNSRNDNGKDDNGRDETESYWHNGATGATVRMCCLTRKRVLPWWC